MSYKLLVSAIPQHEIQENISTHFEQHGSGRGTGRKFGIITQSDLLKALKAEQYWRERCASAEERISDLEEKLQNVQLQK